MKAGDPPDKRKDEVMEIHPSGLAAVSQPEPELERWGEEGVVVVAERVGGGDLRIHCAAASGCSAKCAQLPRDGRCEVFKTEGRRDHAPTALVSGAKWRGANDGCKSQLFLAGLALLSRPADVR